MEMCTRHGNGKTVDISDLSRKPATGIIRSRVQVPIDLAPSTESEHAPRANNSLQPHFAIKCRHRHVKVKDEQESRSDHKQSLKEPILMEATTLSTFRQENSTLFE